MSTTNSHTRETSTKEKQEKQKKRKKPPYGYDTSSWDQTTGPPIQTSES